MTTDQKCNLLIIIATIYAEDGYCSYEDLEETSTLSDKDLKDTIKFMKKQGIITLVNDDGVVYYELKEKLIDKIFCTLGAL